MLLRPPLQVQRSKPTPGWEAQMVKKLMGVVSTKGSDLLLQGPSEHQVKFHRLRASIPSKQWKWKDVTGWGWRKQGDHINVLEMRSVYTTIKWWVKKRRAKHARSLHLVDSLVCLHSLVRGRTSSLKLRRALMRINSLLLCSDLHPIWGYVHTSQNPADRPSRRGFWIKRKWGR